MGCAALLYWQPSPSARLERSGCWHAWSETSAICLADLWVQRVVLTRDRTFVDASYSDQVGLG